MRTLTKEEIEPILGKTSFWFPDAKKQILGNVFYLSGIEVFDGLLAGVGSNILAKPKGMLIQKIKGMSFINVALLNDEIQSWAIEAQEQIFEQKEKSVVGRALIGGLLLGPVGAIVGGMSGIGTKTVKTSDNPDNILSITHTGGIILFEVPNKHLANVRQFFESNYPR